MKVKDIKEASASKKIKISADEVFVLEETLESIVKNYKSQKVKGVLVDVFTAVVILLISQSLSSSKKLLFLAFPMKKIIQIALNQSSKLIKNIKRRKR